MDKKEQFKNINDLEIPEIIKIIMNNKEMPYILRRGWKDVLKHKYLYKYRDWKCPEHRRMLTHDEIFFTSAKEFNDPFDSKIPVRYDLGNEQQILELRKVDLRELNPGIDEKGVETMAKEWLGEKLKRDPYFHEEQKYTEDRENDLYGVFSVTEKPDDILMWSHYSNKHKGFCVGFNVIELLNTFGDLFEIGINQYIIPFKVKYELDYPILNPFTMDGIETIIKSLTFKSRKWSYEKEYRFLMMADEILKDTDRPVCLQEGVIAKVILGCMMADKDRQGIMDVLRNRKDRIELLEARKAFGKFALEFDEIDY